jgi:hypothetical protein
MPTKDMSSQNQQHHGTCPSCGAQTSFNLLGVQRWPERVAKAAGMPIEQTIWQCINCQTTLMERSLVLESA